MQRENLSDLAAFVAVARERSFTAAASKLGVSQSALSHTIRQLETRLGVRLLTRTTRSVSPTQAGERLLQTAGPRIEEIETELSAIRELREKPAGIIRITATEFAIETILVPKLSNVLAEYPDIKIEMVVDYGLTNIVSEQYDAGVRSGEQIAKDMIAVRIGPDMRMAVVGAPSYFRKRPQPTKPQELIGQLHQSATAFARPLCLGVRAQQTRASRPCGRPIDLQHHQPVAPGGARRTWPRLCA